VTNVRPRYSEEEFARRGDEIYERIVRPRLKRKDTNRFVAIDIESGEYEIGDAEIEACQRLRARMPEAQTWLIRVGSRYVHRFGGRLLREHEG